MTLAALLVYALAVARVTRLINEDVLLERPRARVVDWAWKRRYGSAMVHVKDDSGADLGIQPQWRVLRQLGAVEPRLAYLITCPWCASIYVGAAGALLWWAAGSSPWVLVPAAALAFSHVTGLLAQLGGK